MWRSGTVRVAKIAGISIDIHLTFVLIVGWGAWQGWVQHGNLLGATYGILATLALFGCILLHEMGHALRARAYGLVVRRITLLPIGGLAQLETPPSHPWQELVIAFSGPAVNLALAAFFGFIAYLVSTSSTVDLLALAMTPGPDEMWLYLALVNLALFLFNMLPAFPMDGGRILRAGLALVLEYVLATRIAAWLGRIMALGMGLIGLTGWPLNASPNPLLVLVGIVIYSGAQQEEQMVRRQWALTRVEVGVICQRTVDTASPWDSVTRALATRLFRHEGALPVVVDNRVVGLITFHDVRRYAERNPPVTVAHVMRTHFPVLQVRDTLWVALQEMRAHQLTGLPVVDGDSFQGVIHLDDIDHAWRLLSHRPKNADSTLVSGDLTQ